MQFVIVRLVIFAKRFVMRSVAEWDLAIVLIFFTNRMRADATSVTMPGARWCSVPSNWRREAFPSETTSRGASSDTITCAIYRELVTSTMRCSKVGMTGTHPIQASCCHQPACSCSRCTLRQLDRAGGSTAKWPWQDTAEQA